MATHYNPQQQAAIDSSAKTNVIISAGAGSGKTEVLSQKVFTTVVRDHVEPSSLLVLTFTNKAAFEMKERIIAKFQADSALGEKAAEMLSAHVQTFDSFSLYLVKKYSHALGLPDSISLVDESLIETKKEEILDQILEEHYANKDDALLSTLKKFDFKTDSQTKSILLDLDKKLNSLLASKKKRFLEHYPEDFLSDAFFEKCYQEYITLAKDNMEDKIEEALFLYDHADLSAPELLDLLNKTEHFPSLAERTFDDEKLQKRYDALLKLLSFEGDEFAKEYGELCEDNLFNGIKTKIKDVKKHPAEASLHKALAEALDKGGAGSFFTNASNFQSQINILRSFAPDIKVLFSLIQELDTRLFEEKKLTGAFLFSDISTLALSLLEEEQYASIREEIQDRFSFLLVDEYQDTNDFQEEFLTLLSKKATLFVVGDAKQSIYAFRNSDCQLFLDRKERYQKDNRPEEEKVIEMNTNYRSVKAILDDVNTLFRVSMTPSHGGIDYLEESEELHYDEKADLYAPSSLYADGEYGIHLLDYKKDDFSEDEEVSPTEAEARAIVQDIKDKVEHGYLIYTGKNKPLRKCSYRDFAILLRTKDAFPMYQDLFRQYGVPLNNELATSLKEIDAINVLESLLRMVSYCLGESKENPVHLFFSIARSYLFGKEAGYDDQKLYSLLSSEDPLSAIRQDPLYQRIEGFALAHRNSSLSALFLSLLNEFNLIEKLPLVGDSEGNIDKIESFYTMILSQEAMGEGLKDFIDLFHSLSKFQIDLEANSITEIKDAVTLETIHKSKGLQYPIVYLPVSKNKITTGNLNTLPYTFSKTYGLLFPYHGDFHLPSGSLSETFLTKLYQQGEGSKKGEVSEYIRLLYVALTRPKETCYVVGHEKESNRETLYQNILKAYHLKRISPLVLKSSKAFTQEEITSYESLVARYRKCYQGLIGCSDERVNRIRKDLHVKGVITPTKEQIEAKENEFLGRLYSTYVSLLSPKDAFSLYLAVNKEKPTLTIEEIAEKAKKKVEQITQEIDALYKDVKDTAVALPNATTKTAKKDVMTKVNLYLEPLYHVVTSSKEPLYEEEFAFPQRIVSLRPLPIGEESRKVYPEFKVENSEIPYTEKEKKRASKTIVHEESDAVATEAKLERGTYLHSLLENVNFTTKDVSFLKDSKDRALIQKVLSLPIYQLAKEDKVYTEYGYYDPELETTGFVDCLIVRKERIDIIDYKLKNIDEEAYQEQLKAYKRNLSRLYPEKEIHTYLLSILNADCEEVKTE